MTFSHSTPALLPLRRWNGALVNCGLVWLLCGAISAQSFLLPQPGALPRNYDSPRQSEEESDPVESPCEEQEGQFLAASAHRDRHAHAGTSGQRGMHCRSNLRVAANQRSAHSCRPAELSRRNGRGGPLRC
jgi:hypothetical protein